MSTGQTKKSLAAEQLFTFLKSISGKYTLTAQHNYITTLNTYSQYACDITGKYPAIWGCDFSFFLEEAVPHRQTHFGPVNCVDPGVDEIKMLDNVDISEIRNKMVDNAIQQYRNGSIITLMWHHPFPTFGDRGLFKTVWAMGEFPDEKQWNELITEGTEINTKWAEQADRVAVLLARLRDANIPVLWRPYHEMNGVWFWWCNKKGPKGFPTLWRMMHDRFTKVHKLDNLVWVWNTNAPRDKVGDEAFPYPDFYPGEDCVDVLAADVYGNDYKQSHHDDLLRLANGKPIALGEVGGVPAPEVLKDQPSWTWFMPWGASVNRWNKAEAVKALYNDPRVVSRERVLRDETGTYSIKE